VIFHTRLIVVENDKLAVELAWEFQPGFANIPNGVELPYMEGWLHFHSIITCITKPEWPGQNPAEM
jgi:hypothetical protein